MCFPQKNIKRHQLSSCFSSTLILFLFRPYILLGKSNFIHLWFQSIFLKKLVQSHAIKSMSEYTLLWCALHSLLTNNVWSCCVNIFWTPGWNLFGHVNFKMLTVSNGSLEFSLATFKTEFHSHCDSQMYDKAPSLIHNEYSFSSSFFFLQ